MLIDNSNKTQMEINILLQNNPNSNKPEKREVKWSMKARHLGLTLPKTILRYRNLFNIATRALVVYWNAIAKYKFEHFHTNDNENEWMLQFSVSDMWVMFVSDFGKKIPLQLISDNDLII